MNKYRNLTCFTLVLVAVVLFSLMQARGGYAIESTPQEKTLQFLSDVALIDLSKYNVTLRSDEVEYLDNFGGAPEERVRYILQNSNSYLDATVVFIKGVYTSCLLSWRSGSPIYSQPQPTDLVDMAKVVLERFQTYTGSSRYQSLRGMLDSVSKAENTNVTSGGFKLQVTVNGRATGFRWLFNLDGAEATALKVSLHDGTIHSINDHIGIFNISDAEATVSREEAIDIAVEHALNCSWSVTGVSYMAESVPRELAMTQLFLTASLPRDPFMYYPFWRVDLWLGKTYPGGVNHIAVGIWADTGEVKYVTPLGVGGGVPAGEPADSSTPGSATSPDTASPPDVTPPPTQQPTDTTTPFNPIPIAATAATIVTIGIAATALLFKKRRK